MFTKLIVAGILIEGTFQGAAFCQAPARPAEGPFAIEEYDFTWNVAKEGDADLRIRKDQESTTVVVSKDIHSQRMLPEDAAKVGAVLATTDTYFNKMKGTKADASEVADAGTCSVTFRQSVKYGFSVTIADKESPGFRSVYLDRKAANAFAPHLKNSVAMVKHVDKVIDGALAKP